MKLQKWATVLVACYTYFVYLPYTHASEKCDNPAAKVQSFQGVVEYNSSKAKNWQKVTLQQVLCAGDSVRLEANSRAALRLENDTLIRLDENSELVLSSISIKKPSWIDLLKGIVHFISRTPESLEIRTPFVNAAIEGTEFVVTVDSEKSRVTVFDGKVRVENENGKVVLSSSQSAITQKNDSPKIKLLLSPRDELQWALHYPPLIDYQSAFISSPEAQDIIKAYFDNNFDIAFSKLDELTSPNLMVDALLLRSSLLLGVGRATEANIALDKVLTDSPGNASVFAMKSIIALTQGNISQSQEFAQKSASLKPDSAVGKLALSYIAQSKFELERARTLIREASTLSPDSPFIWARLAELELSFQALDLALDAANKAVTLVPEYSHTLVTLGFAHLYRFDSTEALKIFTRAIKSAPYSPLANLGLGLSTILKGDLNQGTQLIETAAIMDPNNSLLRSYLGKAYYEQGRFELAESELNIAKKLDAKDPTPYFYSALLYAGNNQPNLAISNLGKSISLNDNRAVFRSRQLLDRDLSSRNTNLSLIYNTLGFSRSALSESWKAINTDPTNFSAHQFLSDSYSLKPRHEIAAVSENLQSKLLQPISVSPRPGTPPTNIIVNSEIYNIFPPLPNSLFSKNGSHSSISAISGNNNTKYVNMHVFGIEDRFSYSFNHRDYNTDGFQINDSFNQAQTEVFTQFSVGNQLSIQLEYKDEMLKAGDIPYRVNDFHQATLLSRIETSEKRIGLRYKINVRQLILFSAISSDLTDYTTQFNLVPQFQQSFPGYGIETRTDVSQEADSFEFQFSNKSRNMNTILGAGKTEISDSYKTEDWGIFNEQSFLAGQSPETKGHPKHNNAYLYNYLNINSIKSTLITGLSLDQFTAAENKKNEINPKLGFLWTPNNKITVRAAAFKVFKRSIVTNKTLEPTQIAGFNQLYDDFNASPSYRYGLGMDYNWKRKYFIGIESSKRNIEQREYLTDSFIDSERNETDLHAYIYGLPHKYISISAELTKYTIKQEVTNDQIIVTRPNFVDTLTLPITLKILLSKGIYTSLKGTYVDQKTEFKGHTVATQAIRDRFPVFDISVQYNLPRKFGTVSLSIQNIFEENMKYQSNFDASTPRASPYSPERGLFSRIQLFF